jgi:ribosomal protein S18 acetylase RimI-like enzyme
MSTVTPLLSALDDPILAALATRHAGLARVHGLALRYGGDVSPMAALRRPGPEAFADLREIVAPGEVVALVARRALDLPDDWEAVLRRPIEQMVFDGPAPSLAEGPPPRLGDADVPDMLALTALTKPGPFAPRTIRMGRFYGLRAPDGRLMAMAGERLAADEFTEVSGVCTHPDFAGRGLGRRLVAFVVAQLLAEGRQPVLHVKNENLARGLYERLGFRSNGDMAFTLARRPAT